MRTRKIQIFPNRKQKRVLHNWNNTTRYVYNKVIADYNTGTPVNFIKLRNKHVTALNNENVKEWEKETPKLVREGAVKEMEQNYNSAVSNYKAGNIPKFKLKFKSKKKTPYVSMTIAKSAMKLNSRRNTISIYPTKLNTPIRLAKDKSLHKLKITHDSKLKYDNGKWFMFIPIDVPVKTHETGKSCGIDPGVRNFHVIYSDDKVTKIEVHKEAVERLRKRIDRLKSLRDRKLIKKQQCKRKCTKLQEKFTNLVDDIHFRTIHYVSREYDEVFLPKFESQELSQGTLHRTTKRSLLSLKHYRFKLRLKSKIQEYSNKKLHICTEEYTSKTCTNCGNVKHNLGSNEIYDCTKCGLEIERDINGARNILIKNK